MARIARFARIPLARVGAASSLLAGSQARAAGFETVSSDMFLRQLARDILRSSGNISVDSQILSSLGFPGGTSLRRALKILRAVRGYAPKVWLHPDEGYFPTSVDWYLPRVRLRFHRNNAFDVQAPNAGSLPLIIEESLQS